MRLNELREQFEGLDIKELDKYSCTEVADKYLSSSSISEKNKYVSFLICNNWNLLQRIFYTNNNSVLTEEECYDIFIQTFHYVIKMHVWTNPDSSLYNDSQAFEKAMAITIQSRRKNYLKAKFRQKRIVNNTNFSLDNLEEDFQEGYFSKQEDNLIDVSITKDIYSAIESEIIRYCGYKLYLTGLILEGIIYHNTYDEDGDFDMRKMKKYLKNLSPEFRLYFKEKYHCADDFNELTDFSNMNFTELETKIRNSFTTLKHNDIIKEVLNK